MEFEGYHQVVVSISWEQDEQPNPPLLEDNCNANSLVLESDNQHWFMNVTVVVSKNSLKNQFQSSLSILALPLHESPQTDKYISFVKRIFDLQQGLGVIPALGMGIGLLIAELNSFMIPDYKELLPYQDCKWIWTHDMINPLHDSS